VKDAYPPRGHLLRELEIRFVVAGDDWRSAGEKRESVQAAMNAGRSLSHDGVSVPIGVLATFVDLVAGRICAGAARPDWVVTSDLSVLLDRPMPLGVLWSVGRVVRAGQNLVVSTVELGANGTSDDKPGARATSAFGRLGGDSRGAGRNSRSRRSPEGKSATALANVQGSDRPVVTTRPEGSLMERIGLESTDGIIETTLRDYTSNSLGALQGGVAAMMFECAAIDSASARGFDRPWVSELSVRYLSLGKTGPFRTCLEAEMLNSDALVQRFSILDYGAVLDGEPKKLSVASATSRPWPTRA